MPIDRLLVANARLLTLAASDACAAGPRRASALRDMRIIPNGWLLVDAQGRISGLGAGSPAARAELEIDAGGRLVSPAFVDCHTHACWAGDRLGEWEMKLAGADYLAILKAGGGIMSTVRATRAASHESLVRATVHRLSRMCDAGTLTVEVKSGYGLNTAAELRMLAAIDAAAARVGHMRIVSTFLGAHALDPEQPDFVERTIHETLPEVARRRPGLMCDAYCEKGAWPLADTRAYLESARSAGCPLRLHTDQFNSLGGTRLALELGARSVDHLEALDPADVPLLGSSSRTSCVLLPLCGLHLDDRYAPGRALLDAGAAVSIATNFNPGSAPWGSMPLVMGTACRKMRFSTNEAWIAATINPASVLGVAQSCGSLEPGKSADLILWPTSDEREVPYEMGQLLPGFVFSRGALIAKGGT